jgi:hypothetical protein
MVVRLTVVRPRFRGGVDYGELETLIKEKLVEALREELTSGDGNVKTLLAQLLLSAVLRDSAGVELSGYLKNLDVGLSTIKSQTDRLNFDAGNRLRVSPANAEIIMPVDLQARFKPAGMTLFSGTVTASGGTADIDVSMFSALELILKVTAVSGTTPTLSVYIEGRFDATGDYKPLVFQESITSTGIWYFTINPCVFRYIRVRWLVSGTSPSFTFTVATQAMV